MRAWDPRRIWTPAPRPDDDLPATRGECRTRAHRDQLAYGVLVFVSVAAAWLGYDAGEQSDAGLRRAARAQIEGACRERVEGRIGNAQGLDALRRAAVKDPDSARAVRFLRRTQPPIDRQLTRAAMPGDGDIVRKREEIHVGPGDVLTEEVVAPVRARGFAICHRAGERFEEHAQDASR